MIQRVKKMYNNYNQVEVSNRSLLAYVSSYIALVIISSKYMIVNSVYPMYEIELASTLSIPIVIIFIVYSLIPILWSPSAISNPSDFIYYLLYLLVYVPSGLFTLLINGVNPAPLTFLIVLLISIRIFSYLTRLRVDLKQTIEIPYSILYLLSGLLIAGMLGLLTAIGISWIDFWKLLDFSGIYQQRDVWGATVIQYPTQIRRLIIVFISSMMYVILPWLFITGISMKSPTAVAGSLLGWAGIFGATGFRSAIIIPITILGIQILSLAGYSYLRTIFIGLLSSIIVSLVLHTTGFFGYAFPLVTRIIAIPGITTGLYFDFFAINEHIYYLSRTLGIYPYSDPDFQNMLMVYYFNEPGSLNSNLWSTGFARLGYIGPIALTLIFSLISISIDTLSRDIRQDIKILLVVPFIIPFLNSALTTIVLTHGLPILLLLLFIHPHHQPPDPVQ